MHGVTAAIIGFIFVCVVFPSLVKNRPQFYAALAAALLIIFLDSLGHMIRADRFNAFIYFLTGLLQIGAIVLLFLSCGGLTLRELAGDMARAYEVIRRGEEEKEIIIPIGGQASKRKEHDEPRRTVYHIDTNEPDLEIRRRDDTQGKSNASEAQHPPENRPEPEQTSPESGKKPPGPPGSPSGGQGPIPLE